MSVSSGSGISLSFTPKDNLSATTAPTVNDDISLEYSPGSRWIDLSADKLYVCLDNTDSAAVWTETTIADSTLTGLTDGTTVSLGHTAESITTGTANTFVGLAAGDAITSAIGTTAVGNAAASALTTTHDNTALGDSALALATGGSRNTAVGTDAMAGSITVGNDNVAVGKGASNKNQADNAVAIGTWSLNANTTGAGQVAVGFGALRYVTTAIGNTAVGYLSLGATPNTGTENTAVGFSAMASNTSASKGTALGWNALENNSTGWRCTAIGHSALLLAEGANDCTAVGYFSLDSVTSGQFNTAVGSNSGSGITSGEDNTLIGYKAGLLIATASGNVCIGSEAGSQWTGSNALFIDVTNTTTPLIGGDFSARTVKLDATLDARVASNAQTGTTYTLVLTDSSKLVTMANAAANTLTIPTNAAVAFPVNTRLEVVMKGAGVTTIAGDTGVTLNGVSAGSGAINTQYQGVVLTKIATDTWLMSGDHAVVA